MINTTRGYPISDGEVARNKSKTQKLVTKYGRNPDVDGPEDIWNGGGEYTGFPTTAAEVMIVAANSANDTLLGTGARTIRVWYLDEDYDGFDANGDHLFTDIDLTGLTPVDTGILVTRIWRAKVISSGTLKSNDANITIRWKDTPTVVFAQIPAMSGQTSLSNFTIPAGYTGLLRHYMAELQDSNANRAEMAIKVIDFGSNTARYTRFHTITNDVVVDYNVVGGIPFTEKTDFCFSVLSVSSINASITCSYELHLIKD